jgi:ribose/xylose/arabinose/galactoside ABC-type transport system permease subunit
VSTAASTYPLREPAQVAHAIRPPHRSTALIIGFVVLLAVVAALTTPNFYSVDNLRSIVGVATVTGIAAIGLTFVTISGNFVSLSTSQSALTAAIAFAYFLSQGWPLAVALVATLAIAAAIGVAQGWIVGVGANPIIVTLAAGAAMQGTMSVLTGGSEIRTGGQYLTWLGGVGAFGITVSAYVMLAAAVVATIFLRKHRIGIELALVGENRLAGAGTGYSTRRVAMLAFAMASLAAALVGIISVSSFQRASVDQFGSLTFDAIAAVLIGGTAIAGGTGSPLRTAAGAVFIAMLANFMLLHDWSFGARLAVQGLAVVLAVSLYQVISGNRTRS